VDRALGRRPDARLERLETLLGRDGCLVTRGGDYDDWDLEVRAGGLSAVRIVLAIEEPARGDRWSASVRCRTIAPPSASGWAFLSVGALLAGLDGVITAATVLGMAGLVQRLTRGRHRRANSRNGPPRQDQAGHAQHGGRGDDAVEPGQQGADAQDAIPMPTAVR